MKTINSYPTSNSKLIITNVYDIVLLLLIEVGVYKIVEFYDMSEKSIVPIRHLPIFYRTGANHNVSHSTGGIFNVY